MLIAEDHSEWDKVTELPEAGGLGFDATWFAAFYHNLIGDSDMAGGRARLLRSAGFGDDGPLDIASIRRACSMTASTTRSSTTSRTTRPATPAASMRTTVVRGQRRRADRRDPRLRRGQIARRISACRCSRPARRCSSWAKRSVRRNPIDTTRSWPTARTSRASEWARGARLFRFYQDAIRFSRRHSRDARAGIDVIHVNDGGTGNRVPAIDWIRANC